MTARLSKVQRVHFDNTSKSLKWRDISFLQESFCTHWTMPFYNLWKFVVWHIIGSAISDSFVISITGDSSEPIVVWSVSPNWLFLGSLAICTQLACYNEMSHLGWERICRICQENGIIVAREEMPMPIERSYECWGKDATHTRNSCFK